MSSSLPVAAGYRHRATLVYVAPFLVFVALMALERTIALPPATFYPIRLAAVLLTVAFVSWPAISLRASAPWGSVAVGTLVFLIWIAPDILFGPGYRQSWIFSNAVMGNPASSISPALRQHWPFLAIRTISCAVAVPILEELFWRGWLMRWLIDREFLKVPLGAYAPSAFWAVALLFASEHGSFWEVGLAAGIIYNWWCMRTKNLADCILAHAVTNGILSAYILYAGQWQYWL